MTVDHSVYWIPKITSKREIINLRPFENKNGIFYDLSL
jgi:hypothetical protein